MIPDKESMAMSRILVVDDDRHIRNMLLRIFEGQGYDVSLAENGKHGLEVLAEQDVDLIVSDILMPEKDGLEMISTVKELYPDIKIVAMSGGGHIGSENYLRLAQHMGAERTIQKVIMCEDIIRVANELLREF